MSVNAAGYRDTPFMTRPSIRLAGTSLVVLALLTGCGVTHQEVAPKATAPAQTLIAGTWKADAICPAIRVAINKYAPWAVQGDNTNRACVVLGQMAPQQNVGAIVNLRGGMGKCPNRHLPANMHAIQVSGLGAQACLVTGTRSGPEPFAVAEWGITFNAQHSIDINCANQTNANLGQLMPECRMVLRAVLASLYKK